MSQRDAKGGWIRGEGPLLLAHEIPKVAGLGGSTVGSPGESVTPIPSCIHPFTMNHRCHQLLSEVRLI